MNGGIIALVANLVVLLGVVWLAPGPGPGAASAVPGVPGESAAAVAVEEAR